MQRDDFNVCCLPESGRFAVHGMNSTISLEVAFVSLFVWLLFLDFRLWTIRL